MSMYSFDDLIGKYSRPEPDSATVLKKRYENEKYVYCYSRTFEHNNYVSNENVEFFRNLNFTSKIYPHAFKSLREAYDAGIMTGGQVQAYAKDNKTHLMIGFSDYNTRTITGRGSYPDERIEYWLKSEDEFERQFDNIFLLPECKQKFVRITYDLGPVEIEEGFFVDRNTTLIIFNDGTIYCPNGLSYFNKMPMDLNKALFEAAIDDLNKHASDCYVNENSINIIGAEFVNGKAKYIKNASINRVRKKY